MDNYPKTVFEMQSQLSNHPDVGTAMTIKRAIDHLVDGGKITVNDEINFNSLEKIRQAIYDTNDSSRGVARVDPMIALFEAILSNTVPGKSSGSPVDGALNYIEDLQRRYGRQVK